MTPSVFVEAEAQETFGKGRTADVAGADEQDGDGPSVGLRPMDFLGASDPP